jgi:hypothetical protein
MGKLPSPCISVCKFRIKGGHCIGCSMTKPQKKLFKGLKKDILRDAFVTMLVAQQEKVKSSRGWAAAYARKCSRKDTRLPAVLRRS